MFSIKKVIAVFFSATGTTKKIVTTIAESLSELLAVEYDEFDFTLPISREQVFTADKDSIVIFGTPVYAGRVPNVLLKYLETIRGNGALAVPVVAYGNRNYDDALIELRDILLDRGFRPIAAGAFIAEHSFSRILAKGRPDDEDVLDIKNFAEDIFKKIGSSKSFDTVGVKGTPHPYSGYYRPLGAEGQFIDIRKVKPETTSECISCELCVRICPMGSIDVEDVSLVNGICIKCCACIKKCPVGAKMFTDVNYLYHKHDLEKIVERKEPELFL